MRKVTESNIERVYDFNGKRHMVSEDEWDAIHRSGKPHSYDSYSSDPTLPEVVHGAIHLMHERPGATLPGGSPAYFQAVSMRIRKNLHSELWKRTDVNKLVRARDVGYAWWHIARSLGRHEMACRLKYYEEMKLRSDE